MLIHVLLFYLLIDAVIGLALDERVVDEDVGELEVCVVVVSPQLDCPIVFPFQLSIFTASGTAGKQGALQFSQICYSIVSVCQSQTQISLKHDLY